MKAYHVLGKEMEEEYSIEFLTVNETADASFVEKISLYGRIMSIFINHIFFYALNIM